MADVDILVKFDRSTPRDRFTDAAHDVGFAALDEFGPYVRYSEHPFVEAVIRGTKINVVPCFDVQEGQWQSAADRTPFHTRFMQDRLSEPMRCEIRLLKQFLRCNGLYGSEISKQGFSGYVTEVLVLHFGSFEGVVRGFAGACPGWTVGKTPKKFDTPVVIIDPVDPQRNLAAAISNGNMGRFVLLCRAFLRGPSASFFEATKRRTDVEILKNCITIRFRYRARSPDMIWGQIKRASNAVAVQLDQGGFNVIRGGALTDEQGLDAAAPGIAAVMVLPDETTLSANYPNPFNPETWIPYQLANPSDVVISIYDGRGRVVRRLAARTPTCGVLHPP